MKSLSLWRAAVAACTMLISYEALFAKPVSLVEEQPRSITKLLPPYEPVFVDRIPEEKKAPSLQLQATPTFYDHGNPRPIEQLILDRVNRARSNPGAEAARLGIDLNEDLDPGTIEDTPKQPLAMNPHLIEAARDHSIWMLDANIFSHTGEGGSTVPQRIDAAGYPDRGWAGENIAYQGTFGSLDTTASTLHLHDGLFLSEGHRVNMMNNNFNETGFGNETGIFTSNGYDYNALMITHKFASSFSSPSPFVVGTVYYDFSEDGLFFPGEQISNVEITIEDAEYYTLTADAGGYALPLPASTGSKQITFYFDGMEIEKTVLPNGSENVQRDLILPYDSPEKQGPPFVIQGQSQEYHTPDLFGATAFRFYKESHYPAPDDDPTDLSRMDISTSGVYSPLQNNVQYTGTHAYQLLHPEGISTEILQYTLPFIPGPNGEMSFHSRIRSATSDQIAHVEISTNEGSTWESVYSQPGDGWETETQFHQRTVSLSDYQDQIAWIRFRYQFDGGSYYDGTSEQYGWFIDNVQFTDVSERDILDQESVAAGQPYMFTTSSTNTYQLRVRPLHYGSEWPAGPANEIQSFAPLNYAAWAAEKEMKASLPSGTLANNPDADYSGDGIANLMAYAMNLDPAAPVSPTERPHLARDGDYMNFVYWKDHRATDIETELHVSTDIDSWYAPADPLSPIEAIDEHVAYDGYREQRRIRIPRENAEMVFIRHHVMLP